jgi:hypothetical protein
MGKKLLIAFMGFACFLVGSLITRYSSAAQSPQVGEAVTSQVLVQEIRALRRTLQDFTASNSRAQFAIERFRMQQLQADRMAEQASSIQAQIDANEDLINQSQETVKNLERSLASEEDSLHRDEIDHERKAISTNIELYKQRNQKLEERKLQVSSALQAEKNKLNELQDILDQLSRSNMSHQSERK